MRGAQQLAGESAAQYLERLQNEIEDARRQIDRHDRDAVSERLRRSKAESDAERERDFLRDQLTYLQQQIASPSAPRTRGQMARLLDGLLRGEDWRNGTWR